MSTPVGEAERRGGEGRGGGKRKLLEEDQLTDEPRHERTRVSVQLYGIEDGGRTPFKRAARGMQRRGSLSTRTGDADARLHA